MMAHSGKPKLSSRPLEPNKKSEAEVGDSQGPIRVEEFLGYLEDRLERRFLAERPRLLLDVANLRGHEAVSWFWKKWPWLWPETPQDLIELRDELREIWRRDREFSEWATPGFPDVGLIAAPDAPRLASANYFLNKWLSWRPSAGQEEARKSLERNRALAVAANPVARSIISEIVKEHVDISTFLSTQPGRDVTAPFKCSMSLRRLIPEPFNLRGMLVQGVLEHWGRLKYCANTNCLSPYFIAKRKDQTVCDAEICKAEKQREHARKWWNENRAKQDPKQAKVDSKPTVRRSRKNVTHKVR